MKKLIDELEKAYVDMPIERDKSYRNGFLEAQKIVEKHDPWIPVGSVLPPERCADTDNGDGDTIEYLIETKHGFHFRAYLFDGDWFDLSDDELVINVTHYQIIAKGKA